MHVFQKYAVWSYKHYFSTELWLLEILQFTFCLEIIAIQYVMIPIISSIEKLEV